MSDWEKALAESKVYAGSFDPTFWRTYLIEHPEVLHHILADLHQVAGVDKGRPPNLDDLWELVAPTFSDQPFPQAFQNARGARSVRQIAGAVHLHHEQVRRYLDGRLPIIKVHDSIGSMRRLELFAKALGVRPAYFMEWRRLWIMSVIDSALESRPNVSVSIYRKFSGQEARSQSAHAREGRVDGATR